LKYYREIRPLPGSFKNEQDQQEWVILILLYKSNGLDWWRYKSATNQWEPYHFFDAQEVSHLESITEQEAFIEIL